MAFRACSKIPKVWQQMSYQKKVPWEGGYNTTCSALLGIWALFSMTPWRVSKPGDEATGEPEADSWLFP